MKDGKSKAITKVEEPIKSKGRNKGWNNLVPCKPGETHNPNGRPLGKKNYETYMREAIISYAKKNGKTPEEVESLIYEKQIEMIDKGEYNFSKDYNDRIHGKPRETLSLDFQGEVKISKLDEITEATKKILNEK